MRSLVLVQNENVEDYSSALEHLGQIISLCQENAPYLQGRIHCQSHILAHLHPIKSGLLALLGLS